MSSQVLGTFVRFGADATGIHDCDLPSRIRHGESTFELSTKATADDDGGHRFSLTARNVKLSRTDLGGLVLVRFTPAN